MPRHEDDIATYLTLDGQVFLAPQYNVAYDKDLDEGGTCPDFVALDLRMREVVIVEVTMAVNVKPLIQRVKERETRWYKPIRRKMKDLGVVDDSWKPTRFLGFVRDARLQDCKQAFYQEANVAFWPIEKATFIWSYWDERMSGGLPR